MLYTGEEKKNERFWTGNIVLFITVLLCLYLMMNSADLFHGIRYGSPVYRICSLILAFSAGYGAAFFVLEFCRGSMKRMARGIGFLFGAEVIYVLYRLFFGMHTANGLSLGLLFAGSLAASFVIAYEEKLIV